MGDEDGLIEGDTYGGTVGLDEGSTLGDEGTTDGVPLGMRVEPTLGIALGAKLGFRDGATVGEEGAKDGDLLGRIVGGTVGDEGAMDGD